jgi:hypothetical protein
MSQIQIICTSPGMRRQGIVHTASAIYEEGHWTEAQLQAFKDDPSFIVQPVGQGGVQLSGDDFEAAVAARVTEQLTKVQDALQVTFETAVTEKAKERVERLQSEHATAVADLNQKIADLTTKLNAATKVDGEGETAPKTKK